MDSVNNKCDDKLCCNCWYRGKINEKSYCENEKSANYGERINISETCDEWDSLSVMPPV